MSARHIVALFATGAMLVLLSACGPDLARKTVVVGQQELEVWIADTEQDRAEGLMAVPRLDDDEGMLFVWEDPGFGAFVIKDVDYALDVAFVAEDGRILAIESLAPGGPERAESRKAYLWAIEARAGWFEEKGVAEGDTFEYSPDP